MSESGISQGKSSNFGSKADRFEFDSQQAYKLCFHDMLGIRIKHRVLKYSLLLFLIWFELLLIWVAMLLQLVFYSALEKFYCEGINSIVAYSRKIIRCGRMSKVGSHIPETCFAEETCKW